MSEFRIGISKHFQNSHKVHNIPLTFIPPEQITKRENQLLEILEPRSWHNNGDTKIYNTLLVKITKWSLRTLERVLHSLETKRLISRLLTRGYDNKRLRANKGPFYTLRTIRCWRVAQIKHYRFLSTKELGWKTDNRPKMHIERTGIDPRWCVERAFWYLDRQTLKEVFVQPMWTNLMQLADRNTIVPKIMDLSVTLLSDRDYGSEEAKLIMGFPKTMR